LSIECDQHTLKEIGSPLAHSRVDECLGRLDMVVEVVAEGLDVRDNFGPSLVRQVAGEQDYEYEYECIKGLLHGTHQM
jgi:hypothetical protein